MEIRRFFIQPNDIKDKTAEISGEEFTHAVKVLRQKVGYRIILNTGDGYDYFAEITDILKNSMVAKIVGKEKNEATPNKKIVLYQGSLKQGKNDFVVQKSVELGVSELIFFDSKNVVEKNVNSARLNKIAVEAMKQCGRADKIVVDYLPYEKAVERAEGTVIMFYEGDCDYKLSNLPLAEKNEVSIFVGSEGGFDEKEIELAREKGFFVTSLGKRILRAETASIVATALVTDKIGGLE